MRVVAVVQARSGSSRLPGKVMADLGGLPVVEWVLRAARLARGVDAVVVATTTSPRDDGLAAHVEGLGLPVVRGPDEDVLARFVQTVDVHPCDAVVRLTADCPLLDPELVALVVATWRAAPSWDYVATTLNRTLPRGLDVELVRTDVLRGLDEEATAHHRQHVTSLLYTAPAGRRLLGLSVAPPADDLRVTLDTPPDQALLDAVVARTGNRVVGWQELVMLLRSHPDLAALNRDVEQKALEAG